MKIGTTASIRRDHYWLLCSLIAWMGVPAATVSAQEPGAAADPAAPPGWARTRVPEHLEVGTPGVLPGGRAPRVAAQAIASAAGIAAEAAVLLSESRQLLPYTGVEVLRYKVRDARTGAEKAVVVASSGEVQDYGRLVEAENAEKYRRFGAMYPPLHDQLSKAEQSQEVAVMIKLAVAESELDKSRQTPAALAPRALEQRSTVTQSAGERLSTALASVGLESAMMQDARVDGPFVFATMGAEDAMRLARGQDVVFVGPYYPEDVEDTTGIWSNTDLDDALTVSRTNDVHSLGIKGDGVRLAVMETGQADVPLSCFDVAARQTTGGSTNSHMTNSMLIWGNTDDDYNGSCGGSEVGYAPDAEILMANAGSSNTGSYASRYEWAKDNGVDVVSMSFHAASEETSSALHARDIYFDYWSVHYPYTAVFTSAGNQADGAYASGKGYNFFGVANMALDTTLGDRCDDDVFDESSWKNPDTTHGDRELPEIAAPGQRHRVYNRTFGGTSCATPVAAAVAGLLIDTNPSLATWPEGIRSIMLAGANYQSGDGANWSPFSDGRDGVGMVNAYYSRLIAATRESTTAHQFRAHDYGSMNASSFTGGLLNKTWTVWNTGGNIRVALVWNSKTTETTSVLDADLDLQLFDSNGTLVAMSNSWDNSYEFLEYEPPTSSGDYTIKVRGYHVPADLSSYYSVAWTVHYDCQ